MKNTLALKETLQENRFLWNSLEIRDLCEPFELLKRNPAPCRKVTAHYDRTQKQRAEECVEKIVQKKKKTPKKKNPGRVRLIN